MEPKGRMRGFLQFLIAACYEIRTNRPDRSRGSERRRRWPSNTISAILQSGRGLQRVL